jgi:hypothetical protein
MADGHERHDVHEPNVERQEDFPAVAGSPDALHHRLAPLGKILAGSLTVLAAVWGAITGTVAWQENRRIALEISAETYAGYYPVAASGFVPTDEIRISVINLSSRAVSLLRGDVLLDKDKVGTIVGAALDSSVSDRGGGEPAPLPFTFSPDTSSKARLQWRASASRLLGETATRLPLTKRKLSVRLELEPGDPQTVPVQTGLVPQQLGGWSALLRLRSNEVVKLVLQAGARSSGPALGKLQLWSAESDRHGPDLTVRRPVAWQVPADFALSLPHGSYRYLLAADDQTVAVGAFSTPCTGEDGGYVTSVCADGKATETKPIR